MWTEFYIFLKGYVDFNMNRPSIQEIRANGRIDADKNWLENIQKYHPIYDFTARQNWEAYFTQFSRLIADLKA
jgi:hypothetical protein